MSLLLSPYSLKHYTFRNRIVISPMCMYSGQDGFANDFHLVHQGSRAVGGAALVMQEATAVSPEGRITANDLGLWKDEHIAKLQQIVSFVHAQGALSGIQLAHAGRKASCVAPWLGGTQIPSNEANGWKTLAPSALPYKEGQEAPIALDLAGIEKVKHDFIAATRRAKTVGYDVLELHGAHGYLFHQFLSPLSNQREDTYGGNLENRMRLLLEVTEGVKQEWGSERLLFVRLSASDWLPEGWSIEDSVILARELKHRGVDLIDTSSGGNAAQARITLGPGYQVPFAAAIRSQADMPTGAVGLITSAEQAEAILQQGQADLIFIARESLRQPYFPLQAAPRIKRNYSLARTIRTGPKIITPCGLPQIVATGVSR